MDLKDAERLFSAARMGTYLAASDGDFDKALALYSWNTQISAECMPTVAYTEVALRNTINQQLSEHYNTPTWYVNNPDLDEHRQEDIDRVLEKLKNKTPTPGQVVANLQFGFWRFTLAKTNHDTLWAPALHKGFQSGTSRKELTRDVSQVNEFRNRIAHHEPIFKGDLKKTLTQINSICEKIDPELAKWVTDQQHNLQESINRNPLTQTSSSKEIDPGPNPTTQ